MKYTKIDLNEWSRGRLFEAYIESMRASLASVMGVDAGCVSVKATTTEKLGFVGRGEGCEVWAVVLVGRK